MRNGLVNEAELRLQTLCLIIRKPLSWNDFELFGRKL